MHYYWFIGNGILRTSVAKNLNGSGRQILLKIPEVDNTISDKIGGGGRREGGGGGGGKGAPPLLIPLYLSWTHMLLRQLAIGHWLLGI